MMRDLEFTRVRVGLQFCRNLFKSSVPSLAKKYRQFGPTPLSRILWKVPLRFRTSVAIGDELTREKGYRDLARPTLNSIYGKDMTRNPTREFHRANLGRIIIKRPYRET